MGNIRFIIPTREMGNWQELSTAYLGNLEGHVEPATPKIVNGVLEFSRAVDGSTRLFVPFPVSGHGVPVLATSVLRERDKPYHLTIELARGRLGQIRDVAADWIHAGHTFPSDVKRALGNAHSLLCRATCCHASESSQDIIGQDALFASIDASEKLITYQIHQQLAVRRQRTSHLPLFLSCPLKGLRPNEEWEKTFCEAFTAAKVAIEWSIVETEQGAYDWTLPDEQTQFTEANRLTAMGGPLIDFRPGGLPNWLNDWIDDYWSLQSFVSDFVETAVKRYAGRIRWWEIAAAPNVSFDDGLDEEYRLALTAKAIEVARQSDDQIQIALRITQPWGEYQQQGQDRLSPRQFAEALVRSGVGLTSVTLEIAIGYEPIGSRYRDRFELSRLIDAWATLGIPITVALAFPSQDKADKSADSQLSLMPAQWKASWNEQSQADWLQNVSHLFMTKKSIAGIEWSHFSDAASHRFPHAGLTNAEGTNKIIMDRMRDFKNSFWQGRSR